MKWLTWIFRGRRGVSDQDLARVWHRDRVIAAEVRDLEKWKAGMRLRIQEQQTATMNVNQGEQAG